ncbi:hypothetical protein [Bradyrhizobium sp. 142]|uniref:hypothetical protein n=1 Tax=Bradyrhizobium sp. 142 TaxID=2782618 RepID=UPI001FF845F3|nr:hypothetical protein [Bradyrhizobium sp. 142]MCK1730980.1 hypothetical protein [Bradyrhizobium sp. 142]
MAEEIQLTAMAVRHQELGSAMVAEAVKASKMRRELLFHLRHRLLCLVRASLVANIDLS